MGREAEAATRERAREWIGGLDFVSREEFEAVKAMAAAARDEAEALKARLDKLEGAGREIHKGLTDFPQLSPPMLLRGWAAAGRFGRDDDETRHAR